MNLPEIYSRIHELETIAGLPETADIFTGELESAQREVMTLNMSTHRRELLKLLAGLQTRQAAYLQGTPPPIGVKSYRTHVL